MITTVEEGIVAVRAVVTTVMLIRIVVTLGIQITMTIIEEVEEEVH
jgi:hypothetical protein